MPRKGLNSHRLLARKENIAGYLFIMPGLIGFLIFMFFPVLFSFFLSFQEWSFIAGFKAMKFVGLDNFKFLFDDYKFNAAFKNTMVFTFTTVPATLVLGLLFAVLIRDHVYGKVPIRTMLFIPYVSSIVAVSAVWLVILHPTYGPVNETLRMLGIENPPKWFGDFRWALPALIIQTVWINLGYYVVVYMAGLTAIPKALYEAAEIDGAGFFRKLFNITLPGLTPTTFFLLIMGIIGSFKVFDQVLITTQGQAGTGTSTLVFALYIFQLAFSHYRMGYASAVAMVMFVMIAIVTAIQLRQQRKFSVYMF